MRKLKFTIFLDKFQELETKSPHSHSHANSLNLLIHFVILNFFLRVRYTQNVKRKMSATNYIDKLIIAKLDYMLALAKLIVAETRYRNASYAKNTAQAV